MYIHVNEKCRRKEEVVSNKGQYLHVGVCEITGALSGTCTILAHTHSPLNPQGACTLNKVM